MSTISFSFAVEAVVVAVVPSPFDLLGDPLYAAQPGVPGVAHGLQLGDRAGQLRLVDLEVPFSAGGGGVHEPDPVQHGEVLGDRLPGDREPVAQRGGGAVPLAEQQVDHGAPGGIADRRPQVLVDRGGHEVATSRATYSPSFGM